MNPMNIPAWIKSKWLWTGVGVVVLLAFPKLDFKQRRWLYTLAIFGAVVAAWLKKISWRVAAVIVVPVTAVWAFTYWQLKSAFKKQWEADVTVTEGDE